MVFAAGQIETLGYGTKINNLPNIAKYRVAMGSAAFATLDRKNLITERSGLEESLDKWMLRFKIYSVESDDVVSIMALARIRPGERRFDPGFYLYGGGYLYPLGAWYFALSKFGVVRPGRLDALLAEPDRMDAVYVFGRLFVLIGFLISAGILYRALLLIASPGTALLALSIYLISPASVMFSQTLKPHWYALLWSNLAIYCILDLFVREKWSRLRLATTGIATGIAVGAALTYALFSIGLWVALLLAWRRRLVGWRTLVAVPVIAATAFAVLNPYMLINWDSYRGESSEVLSNWFVFTTDPKFIGLFIWNSLLPGFGIAVTIVAGMVLLWKLVRPSARFDFWFAAGAILCVIVVGLITASFSDWHINTRYLPFLLPALLLFLAATPLPRRNVILGVVLLLTAVQAIPMLLAYRDENVPARSTRMQAARWIDANVPAGAGIRLATVTLAPYEVPPFDFARYRINPKSPDFLVFVEPEPDRPVSPQGTVLVKRFRPRMPDWGFAFVYGFVNPQISIYRPAGKPGR